MGASSKARSGGNFENPSVGSVAARCYGVVEIGTHEEEFKGEKKKAKKLIIFWELDEKMSDGRPFVINKWFTNSLGEMANLHKVLKSWRGKAFTDAELECFALSNIIGKPCLLNLAEGKTGKPFVDSIMPLPKGMTAPELENPTVDFGIDDINNEELFDSLYEWVQKLIKQSDEYNLFLEGGGDGDGEDPPF